MLNLPEERALAVFGPGEEGVLGGDVKGTGLCCEADRDKHSHDDGRESHHGAHFPDSRSTSQAQLTLVGRLAKATD